MIQRKDIERIVGTKVNDIKIYQTAFVHKSALSETITECNERLEFIGDSVLSLVVTKHLYTSRTLKLKKDFSRAYVLNW